MEIALAILIGLCMGSFATMASHRLPKEESITTKRSHCPKCNHTLSSIDLFPLFSWLSTKGKCRYCHTSISARYPLTEIACATLFALIVQKYGLDLLSVTLLGFATALLIMFVADLETQLIPDEIHLFLIPLGILYHWQLGTHLSEILLLIGVAGGIGLLLHYGYYWLRGFHGLGFGDVKFLFVVGLWLASLHQLTVFIFLSGILGVLTGVIWRLRGHHARFPFAPALAIALLILVIWPEASALYWDMLQRILS